MYHCNAYFYLTGRSCKAFELIQKLPPLPSFTHTFIQCSSQVELVKPGQGPGAELVLANLSGADIPQFFHSLPPGDYELVVLAEAGQTPLLTGYLPRIHDIWFLSMQEAEIRFRFLRWQQHCKREKDAWQASNFLQAVINGTPNLVWFKSRNGIHEKVNDSFCKTVDKTLEQCEGHGHAEIWDVDGEDPACIESERIVMESEQTCSSEEIIRTGKGMRHLSIFKSPLYDLDGSVMGTVGVALDVTKERSYKQEVERKSHALEMIFSTIDCGIMSHSLDGSRIIGVNRAALEILGYPSQEALIADGFQLIAPTVEKADQPLLRDAIHSLTQVGDSVSVEYRVRHKDGKLLHVMGNIKLAEENGERFYQRFLLDHTESKMEEERNRRRQMELVHALGSDYSLICVYDLDTGEGRAVRISGCPYGKLDTMFGGSLMLSESMTQYIQTCVYAEDRDMMLRMIDKDSLKAELSEKGMIYINYRTNCEDKIKYFQIRVVRAGGWESEHSAVLGFRSMDEEIRKEMQKQDLMHEALMQANRANRAKSIFLSNMSHDIRTPMNAIVGFTALALAHLDNPEQVGEYLKKIMTSGNHLLSLLNDILDMSRIESGKMRLEETECSLPDILHSLRSIVQADVHAKQLELSMDAVDVWDEEIFCDRLRLNQVLLNLLSNSIKYTGAGGAVSLRIIELPGAPEGYATYEFHVKDNGIGMSEEFSQHIFEPFERERNSTISGIQGTGLGMAITKNIVDMMQGTISVSSEQGVGTEFTVCLTFRLNRGHSELKTIPQLKNGRALVVDDDYNTCDSVSYMLQQIGMRAEWTLSGKEAVLRTHQSVTRGDLYQVYIIDWLLPDLNGVEVARRIRKEAGTEVPIIVLTAYDWSDIEEEAGEAGITAFCSKPLFLSELHQCLSDVVNTAPEAEPEAVAEPKRRTGRILLAEDNELNQEIAEAILTEAGFTVEIAENGQVALDMLKAAGAGHYQLILSDIQMPVMDGYAMTREIRNLADPKLAEIPIIAMTANAFEEDRRNALRSGMNGHVSKPIDLDLLFNMLDQVM